MTDNLSEQKDNDYDNVSITSINTAQKKRRLSTPNSHNQRSMKRAKIQLPDSVGKHLAKYWYQRYNLFSRYDDGIQMDDESWYSVTPENIAKHIAERVVDSLDDGHSIIVDGFCGVGGNLIQFALCSPFIRVIGCDLNPDRIKMAKHNARIYGVEHQCEFILGDFMNIIPSLRFRKIDAVFLSPPWGGIDYLDFDKYSLDLMTPNGFEIVNQCRRHLTNNIAFLMPRNTDIEEIRTKLLDKEHPYFECEQNMVGNKIKTITMYFGGLVDLSAEENYSDASENGY